MVLSPRALNAIVAVYARGWDPADFLRASTECLAIRPFHD